MFVPDLFNKLKPILGKDLYPLQAVYLAGDDTSRQTVEKILYIYSQGLTGIQPPPFINSIGKFPVGVVLSGNETLHPFALEEEDWFHVGIFGQTGRGKTNAMLHLLQQLSRNSIPWLVFDWKRAGYRDLLSVYDNIQIFTVGRDVSPFYMNPLIPPPGVDNITWYKQFIQCISHAYFLGHGCENILQDVITENTPTLIDVLTRLEIYPAKWRKLQWLQSTERAIKALCYGGISKALNVKECQPISHWLDKNMVLELDALTESEAKFFVNIIMSQIYLYRKEHRHSGLQHVSVIEEAHNVLRKETEHVEAKSVMDKIFREIREYGESIVIIDQMPSTLLDSAIANTATQITLSLKHSDDVKAAGKGMLLDQDESLFLGKLPVGTAIVKLQNRWHAPFMLKLPFVSIKTGKTDDKTIRAKMASFLPETEVIYPEITQPQVIQVISDEDKESKKLLLSIVNEPLLGIAERYRKICLNPKTGNKYKQQLITQGLVKEIIIKTRKGRIKLLELTEQGIGKLAEYGINISKSLRHGGLEHLYWVKRVKKMLQGRYKILEEYPIGNGETVDLAIIADKKIAIEIETGKSDAIGNIRKCLDAGFEVVSVATDTKVFRKMRSDQISKLKGVKIIDGKCVAGS